MQKAFALYFLTLRFDIVEKKLGIKSETLRRNLINCLLEEDARDRVLRVLRKRYRISEERLSDVSHAILECLQHGKNLRTLTFAHEKLLKQNPMERRSEERKIRFILRVP